MMPDENRETILATTVGGGGSTPKLAMFIGLTTELSPLLS